MKRRHRFTAVLIGFVLTGCSWFGDEPEEPVSKPETPEQKASSPEPPPQQPRPAENEKPPNQIFKSVASEAENPVAEPDVNLLSKDYLSDPGYMYVDAFSLMVRRGPGSQYPSHRSLRKGMKVKALEKKGVWIRIGNNEWVSGHYLKSTP